MKQRSTKWFLKSCWASSDKIGCTNCVRSNERRNTPYMHRLQTNERNQKAQFVFCILQAEVHLPYMISGGFLYLKCQQCVLANEGWKDSPHQKHFYFRSWTGRVCKNLFWTRKCPRSIPNCNKSYEVDKYFIIFFRGKCFNVASSALYTSQHRSVESWRVFNQHILELQQPSGWMQHKS